MTPRRHDPAHARPAPLRTGDVSELTTGRLSVYLRCLETLESEGVPTISSRSLAERFHLNSPQIRKDLANFGEFGIRGVGYEVGPLRATIERILGIDQEKRAAIVGAGNLGSALAAYAGFNERGFRVVALFDADPAKAGTTTRTGQPIHPIEEIARVVRDEKVEIGIIAVPPAAAQDAYDRLCDAGVGAVLSFSPGRIELRPGIPSRTVDLKFSLEALSFHLGRRRGSKRAG